MQPKVKVFRIKKTSDAEINKWADSVELNYIPTGSTRDGSDAAVPFIVTPDGEYMIFQYSEKGAGLTKEYHIDRLKNTLENYIVKRGRSSINLLNARRMEQLHKDGLIKTLPPDMSVANCENDLRSVTHQIAITRDLINDIEEHGFTSDMAVDMEGGDVALPAEPKE